MDPEPLEALVRAWTRPVLARARKAEADSDPSAVASWVDALEDLGPSAWSLTFDTEEAASIGQPLRIITYQLRDGDVVVESGIGYDPSVLTHPEIATIESYAREHGLVTRTRDEFVALLFEVAYDLRGLVIGMAMAWDLARLARAHGPARIRSALMRDGFSLDLGGPLRIEIKAANAGGAFIRLVIPGRDEPEARNRRAGGRAANHRGYFFDVGMAGGAMLGGRPSLKHLARVLGTAHQKTDFDAFDGPITPELLDYAVNDAQVTYEVAVALQERFASYALPGTSLYRVHSAASIGKAYYREMGLRPWRDVQPDFPHRHVAAASEAYSGGRVETHVRRLATPGVLVDFQAEYATVSVLMGMWGFHVASGIEVDDEDPDRVRALLERVTVVDVLDPALWRELHALVRVEPDGDRYPVRADYPRALPVPDRRGAIPMPTTRNISRAVVAGGPPQWVTLAEAIASKLETGRAPRVREVRRVRPGPPQLGLSPIDIAGDPRFHVDPYRDDLIKRLVEARDAFRAEAAARSRDGDRAGADLRRGLAKSLKTAANSLAYGVPIEMNVTSHDKRQPVLVVRPDGTAYESRVRRTEEPGRWFEPFIGTFVVAGGRLLLEAALTLIRQAGGTYVMADTDGVFVAATEDGRSNEPWSQHLGPDEIAPPLLAWHAVRAIAERFESLNPFDGPGSILEIEPENWDPETGEQRTIWCFSIAAKRYAVFTPGEGGRPVLVGEPGERKRSEHGLGHLLSPEYRPGVPDDGRWVDRWWEHLLCVELGIDDPEPSWFDLPAVGPLSIRSRHEETNFRAYNAGKPYEQRVRPWGFLIRAFPDRTTRAHPGTPRSLVAAYSRDPAEWHTREWFSPGDDSGATYRIRTGNPEAVIPGTVVAQTYRDYFEEYRIHPESKASAPDGAPCHPWTRGVLGPRHVRIVRHRRIGKEANRYAADGEPVAADELGDDYPERVCAGCGKPIAQARRWCNEACRKRTERAGRRVERTCAGCGIPLTSGPRKWCSDACRKRTERIT